MYYYVNGQVYDYFDITIYRYRITVNLMAINVYKIRLISNLLVSLIVINMCISQLQSKKAKPAVRHPTVDCTNSTFRKGNAVAV